MKKIPTEAGSLRADIRLAHSTKLCDALAFTRRVRGILKHLCHGTEVEFTRETMTVIVKDITSSDDLLIVKAAAWGVAEGMNLELRESDFDLSW